MNYKLKRNESRKKKRIKNGKIEKHFVWSQGVAFLIALVLTLGLFQGGAFPQKEKEGLASVFSRRAVLAAKGKENEPGASYLGKSDWLSMGSRFQEKKNGARPTKADSEKDQPLEKRQGTSTFAVSAIAAEEEPPRISKIAQEAGPSAFVSENPSLALKKEEGSEKKADPVRSEKIYSLDQFRYLGVILWGNYRYTFYSQSVLPGNLLSIKPVIAIVDGEVAVLGKARGSKNGCNMLREEIAKCNGIDFSMPLCLGYTGLEDSLLQKYIEDNTDLWKSYVEELPISSIGSTIGTHTGPGGICVAFFSKTNS